MLLMVYLFSFIQVICPAHCHAMSRRLPICLMMVLRILSFSFIFGISLSIGHLLISDFLSSAFVKDYVLYLYVIAGIRHWLKTFLSRVMGRYCPGGFLCLSQKRFILLLFLLKFLVFCCFPLLSFALHVYCH